MPSPPPSAVARQRREARASGHYRELLRQFLIRHLLLYFVPLLLLATFFNLQYRRILEESDRRHLEAIAEHQANTLDLFVRERLVALSNLVDDRQFPAAPPYDSYLEAALADLRRTSEAFVDLGMVASNGDLLAYVGPVTYPDGVDFATQEWFERLSRGDTDFVITDTYLGFRDRPHFTIAVRRSADGETRILRSALSPEKILDYLSTLEGATEVLAAVVNREGVFQVVTPRMGQPLERSAYVPPSEPRVGSAENRGLPDRPIYAFAWLADKPWALIVRDLRTTGVAGLFPGMQGSILAFTVAFFVLMAVVIFVRARQRAGHEIDIERHEAELSGQLVQAAKLASVGELAAGIAHEINNPLAIIAEEVGLLQDLMDPELGNQDEPLDLDRHLEIIHESVFRCRDITRQLLTFVRQTDVHLERHDIHGILDDLLDGLLGTELTVENIHVVKAYSPDVEPIVTDRNQIVQVFLNIIKNAIDAMPGGGYLEVWTGHRDNSLVVSFADTGCGMTREQLERVFMPFYTTKEPKEGTGLGLSVSLSIIKGLGGKIYVESVPDQGSTFTVELPYEFEE